MKKVRGIIVGTGRAGTHLHYGALNANGADVVAFIDIDIETARKAATRFGVPTYYDSLDEALSREEVDFVSICTTVSSHAELAEVAIKRGVNVLLEKPMTSTVAEGMQLARLAKVHGVNVCVVHNHKFYPGIQAARALVKSGEIGELLHVHREMSFFHERVRMMEEGHWAHDIPGGRFFEANPHNLYLLFGFLGSFELLGLRARKLSERWPHAPYDDLFASFEGKTATASIRMSMNCEPDGDYASYSPVYLLISGTKGTIIATYEHARLFGDVLKNKRLYRSLPTMLLNALRTRLKKPPEVSDAAGRGVNVGVGSGHLYFMRQYLEFLRGNCSEPPVTLEEALFVEEMNELMGNTAMQSTQCGDDIARE